MPETADVVIVGAGLIGCAIAYTLACRGQRVLVLDSREVGREASWASAGLIGIGPLDGSPEAHLAELSWPAYPTLVAQLREETGLDVGFDAGGRLYVWREEQEAAEAAAYADRLARQGYRANALSSAELARLHPALAPDLAGGLWVDAAGQVHPPRLTRAFAAAAARRGAALREGQPVVGFLRRGAAVIGVLTPDGPVAAAAVVLAAGAWTAQLAREVGLDLPVAPARGEIVLLEPPATGPGLGVVVDGPEDTYLIPRPAGPVLVGSTVAMVGFDRRPTAAGVADLLARALAVAPGLAAARVLQAWAGLRPYCGLGRPVIGPVPQAPGLWVATGHFRTGVSQAPATAYLLAQLLLGETPTLDPRAYAAPPPDGAV